MNDTSLNHKEHPNRNPNRTEVFNWVFNWYSTGLQLAGEYSTGRNDVVAVVVGVVVGENESTPDLACGLPTSRHRRCRQRTKRGVDGLETAQNARRTPREAFKRTPMGAIKLRRTSFALVSVLSELGRAETQRKVLVLPCGAY